MIRSTLDETARTAVQDELQPLLTDLIDLALTGKQFHWNVTGPRFRPLHLQLDEFVTAYRTWGDAVAERLTAIGVAPDGRAQRVVDDAWSDPAPQGWLDDAKVVGLLADHLEGVARRTRDRVRRLDDHDLASQDLVIEVLQGLEEQLWMLTAQQS